MKLGFIGTGRMGAPMALNLIKAGHELIVHDVRKEAAIDVLEAGATWAESPAAVAAEVTVVFASLPTPASMEEVALGAEGIAAGAKPGLVFFDLTTNAPAVVQRVGGVLGQSGVTLLDSPVSGGVRGARAGTLAVMVGGDRAAFDAHRPLLEAIGKNVFYLGPLGNGNIAKLVNNAMSFSHRAILAEGLVLGTKAGLDADTLLDIIRASSGDSVAIDRIRLLVETGSFTPNFTVTLGLKDVGLAVQLAREQRSPFRFAGLVEQILIGLQAEGYGDDDTNQLLGRLERMTGVEVRSKRALGS